MQTFTKQTLRIFWQHAKKYPWHVFGISAGVVGHLLLNNYNPILFKKVVDILSVGSAKTNLEPVFKIITLMFFVSLTRMIFARSYNFLNNFFQPRVMADLNNTCFNYLQKHSYAFLTTVL